MCVAAPMRLIAIEDGMGKAELGGVVREVSLALLASPACGAASGAEIGDYVLVHAGFAIGKVDEEEARLTLEALDEIAEGDRPDGLAEA
jgi:hydrogenase expression/formation protein HypC